MITNPDNFKSLKTSLSKEEINISNLLIFMKIQDAQTGIAKSIIEIMEQTRHNIWNLNDNLIDYLTEESLSKDKLEALSKSWTVIEIIIRNLFERTADIGFLTTDTRLSHFIENWGDWNESISSIAHLLNEYKDKYSIYKSINLYSIEWDLLVSSQEDMNTSKLTSDFIDQIWKSWENSYVEYYWDLEFSDKKELVYYYKVVSPETKITLWVLVMSFDFIWEMDLIYKNLNYWIEWSINGLIDKEWIIISANNEKIIWENIYIKSNSKNELITLDWINYTYKISQWHWYQWFEWLWWAGFTMIPSWEEDVNDKEKSDSKNHFSLILESDLIDNKLSQLTKDIAYINDDIGLMILNGQISVWKSEVDTDNGLNPIFNSVIEFSEKIKDIYNISIDNLMNLITESLLTNIKSISKLWIDIMDRNLYERANDVRWWALTEEIQNFLESDQSDEDILKIKLEYINSLYTVYNNIFVFNKNWEILSSTDITWNKHDLKWINTQISDKPYIQDTINNLDISSQSYFVSQFEENPLYWNKYTYTFSSTVRDSNNKSLGGIGVVFNSETEFKDIINDTLDKSPGWKHKDSFWCFIDWNWNIISTTNDNLKIWGKMNLDFDYSHLANWESDSQFISYDWKNYILWVTSSKWYREYKNNDWYNSEVLFMVFIHL